MTFSKLRFSEFKKFVSRSVFDKPQLKQILLDFKTSCCNLKIREVREQKLVWLSYYFHFERNYDVLKLKGQSFLLNKTEWKMKNPTHALGETNLHLKLESQIKSKTVMSWSSRKKKNTYFLTIILSYYFLTSMFFISMYRVFSVLNKLSE